MASVITPVDKRYTDFMDEISPDELYEGLLAYGFFLKNCHQYLPLYLSSIIVKQYPFRLKQAGMTT